MHRALIALCLVATAAVPAPDAAPGKVRVRIETEKGAITVALDARRAPKTVANFLTYVDDGRLDGTSFYRAVRKKGDAAHGFVQGGVGTDFRRTLPPVVLEPTSKTGLRHLDGTISMAHGDDPNSGTCNFSIQVGANPGLDARPGKPGYAAFGQVVSGMDVVRRLLAMKTGGAGGRMNGELLAQPVRIIAVKRLDGTPRPSGRAKPWLLQLPR